MRWFSRRRETEPSRPLDTEEAPEVGGERLVFCEDEGADRRRRLRADLDRGANDPNETLEDPELWLTWEEAEEFARRRELPLKDV